MKSNEFVEEVKKHGFFPIRAEGEADKDKFKGNIIIGSLDEFFAAVKAINSKTVFIYSSVLIDDYFVYQSEYDEDDGFDYDDEDEAEAEEDRSSAEIDLTMVLPALAEHKKSLGLEYSFILTAKGGDCELSYYHQEDWWDDFLGLRSDAIAKVEENKEAIIAKMEKLQEEKDKAKVKLIRELIKDPEFVHIPTQRGMRAYALEKHTELEEMDQATLASEIQILSDKIIAKGLNRKR